MAKLDLAKWISVQTKEKHENLETCSCDQIWSEKMKQDELCLCNSSPCEVEDAIIEQDEKKY